MAISMVSTRADPFKSAGSAFAADASQGSYAEETCIDSRRSLAEASAGETHTIREPPTVWKVWCRLRILGLRVTLIRCCHRVCLSRVAKSLTGILAWEVDMQSLMIEFVIRV